MSYSTQRAVSDGTLKTLLLSIDFLDSSYIKVYVDDVELAYGSAWTWATPHECNRRHAHGGVPCRTLRAAAAR